jgi:hypothetical protein
VEVDKRENGLCNIFRIALHEKKKITRVRSGNIADDFAPTVFLVDRSVRIIGNSWCFTLRNNLCGEMRLMK